jgi:hypothetical protein
MANPTQVSPDLDLEKIELFARHWKEKGGNLEDFLSYRQKHADFFTKGYSQKQEVGGPTTDQIVGLGKRAAWSLPSMAGSTAGEMAGPAIGGALGLPGGPLGVAGGALAGKIIGSSLGAGAGELAAIGGQELVDSPLAPKTMGEGAKRVGLEMLFGAGGPVLGRLAGKAVEFPTGKFGTAADVVDLESNFAKYGGKFTAAQRSDSGIIDFFEKASGAAPLGSKSLQRRFTKNVAALDRYKGDVAKQIAGRAKSLTPREAGEMAEKLVLDADNIFLKAESDKWDTLRAMVGRTPLDTKGIESLSTRHPKVAALVNYWKDNIQGVATDGKVKPWDFDTAHLVKSKLLTEKRKLAANPTATGMEKQILSDAIDELESAMHKSIKDNPDALDLWQDARQFTQYGRGLFKEQYLAGIVAGNKMAPEQIGRAIYANGKVEPIKDVRKAFEFAHSIDPSFNVAEGMKVLKSGYLEATMFGPATKYVQDLRKELTIGQRILNTLVSPSTRDTMKELFTPEEIRSIRRLAQTMDIVQSKPPGGGAMVMQLQQAGVIMRIPKVGQMAQTAGIVLGPLQVSRLMTTNYGRRLLFEGIKTPAKTQYAVSLGAKITAELARITAEEAKSAGIPESVTKMFNEAGQRK